MKILQNERLANYTSLKVGGEAKNLIKLESNDNIAEIVEDIKGRIWILGSGTNTLISDEGLDGTTIINNNGYISVSNNLVTADSGANWDDVVKKAIKAKLFGLELMSGIPGTVGGAIVGNIAAYGQQVADTLDNITVYNFTTKKIITIKNQALDFAYRSSNLQKNKNLIVLSATFKLSPNPTMQLEYDSALKVAVKLGLVPHSLQNRRKIIIETRRQAGSLLSNNSSSHATAGSFFKNPVVNKNQVASILAFEETNVRQSVLLRQNHLHSGKSTRISASHILLASGFKRGQTWGKVRLHPDHILKIENMGGAKAQDIYDVVEFIIGTVKSKLKIELQPEVQFLGNFK